MFEERHHDQEEEKELHLGNPLVQTVLGLIVFTLVGLGGCAFVIYALCLRAQGSHVGTPMTSPSAHAPLAREVQEAVEEMERESPLFVAYKEEGELDTSGKMIPGSIRRSARVQRRPKGWNAARVEIKAPRAEEPDLPPPPNQEGEPKERREVPTPVE